MTFLSKRLSSLQPSATLTLMQKAQELKAQGKDIINLAVGDPDFPTPEWVGEAAYDAIKKGETKYTPVGGTPLLKKAIIEKFKRENALSYAPEEIIVSCGCKQIIFNAFMATLNAGDEVIIPTPAWGSYEEMVRVTDGTPSLIRCPEEQGFKLTPSQLEKAINSHTKWLLLNSPNNPTGVVYQRQELEALAQVLIRHPHVFILCDDIYEHLLFDGISFATLASVDSTLKQRVLTINGVSKAYAMTGWRIGFAGGPAWLIKAMTDLQSQSTSGPCSISQAAAVAALEGPQEILKERSQEYQKRRDLILNAFKDIPTLTWVKPEGAFVFYPSCKDLLGKKTPQGDVLKTDEDFAQYLLESGGVVVVPGSGFGYSPSIRLSFATDAHSLKEGCDRIKKAVDTLTD